MNEELKAYFFSDKKEWLPEKEMIQELKMSYTLDLKIKQYILNISTVSVL